MIERPDFVAIAIKYETGYWPQAVTYGDIHTLTTYCHTLEDGIRLYRTLWDSANRYDHIRNWLIAYETQGMSAAGDHGENHVTGSEAVRALEAWEAESGRVVPS